MPVFGGSSIVVFGILGVIVAIAATVLLYIKVLPKKYDGTFSKKALQFVHDFFNFKKLYLEEVLKVIYTFASVSCVSVGVLVATLGNLVAFIDNITTAIRYDYFGSYIITGLFVRLFIGLAVAVLGPIVLRLAYEGVMMFILLVKNVIDINKKVK